MPNLVQAMDADELCNCQLMIDLIVRNLSSSYLYCYMCIVAVGPIAVATNVDPLSLTVW
jgi:hypothetical protein